MKKLLNTTTASVDASSYDTVINQAMPDVGVSKVGLEFDFSGLDGTGATTFSVAVYLGNAVGDATPLNVAAFDLQPIADSVTAARRTTEVGLAVRPGQFVKVQVLSSNSSDTDIGVTCRVVGEVEPRKVVATPDGLFAGFRLTDNAWTIVPAADHENLSPVIIFRRDETSALPVGLPAAIYYSHYQQSNANAASDPETGGIYLDFFKATATDELRDWLNTTTLRLYAAAVAADELSDWGTAGVDYPSGNPVFEDNTQGNYTETPDFVRIASDDAVLLYHNVVATDTQATLMAERGDNLASWTRKEHSTDDAIVTTLPASTSAAPWGERHAGYAVTSPCHLPGVSYDFLTWTLWGGGTVSGGALWGWNASDPTAWTRLTSGRHAAAANEMGLAEDGRASTAPAMRHSIQRDNLIIELLKGGTSSASGATGTSSVYQRVWRCDGPGRYTLLTKPTELILPGTIGDVDSSRIIPSQLIQWAGRYYLIARVEGDTEFEWAVAAYELDLLAQIGYELETPQVVIGEHVVDTRSTTETIGNHYTASVQVADTNADVEVTDDGLEATIEDGPVAIEPLVTFDPEEVEAVEVWVPGVTRDADGESFIQAEAGFGEAWLTGVPMATSTQGRDMAYAVSNTDTLPCRIRLFNASGQIGSNVEMTDIDLAIWREQGGIEEVPFPGRGWGARWYPRQKRMVVLGDNRTALAEASYTGDVDLTGIFRPFVRFLATSGELTTLTITGIETRIWGRDGVVRHSESQYAFPPATTHQLETNALKADQAVTESKRSGRLLTARVTSVLSTTTVEIDDPDGDALPTSAGGMVGSRFVVYASDTGAERTSGIVASYDPVDDDTPANLGAEYDFGTTPVSGDRLVVLAPAPASYQLTASPTLSGSDTILQLSVTAAGVSKAITATDSTVTVTPPGGTASTVEWAASDSPIEANGDALEATFTSIDLTAAGGRVQLTATVDGAERTLVGKVSSGALTLAEGAKLTASSAAASSAGPREEEEVPRSRTIELTHDPTLGLIGAKPYVLYAADENQMFAVNWARNIAGRERVLTTPDPEVDEVGFSPTAAGRDGKLSKYLPGSMTAGSYVMTVSVTQTGEGGTHTAKINVTVRD